MDFTYYEEGEKKTFSLEIYFISRGIRKLIEHHLSKLMEFHQLFQKQSNNVTELAAARINKDNESVKKLQLENKDILNQFANADVNEIEAERINIMRRILKDNAIKDHKLFDDEFIDNCTEPTEVINFLRDCWMKDMPKETKKKM